MTVTVTVPGNSPVFCFSAGNLVPKRWDKKGPNAPMWFRKPKKAVTGRYNGRQNTSIISGMEYSTFPVVLPYTLPGAVLIGL